MNRERAAIDNRCIAFDGLAKVVKLGFKILAGSDMAQVMIVLIRARDHIAAAAQGFVGEDSQLNADWSERSGVGSKMLANFFGMRCANLSCAGDAA